MPDYHGVSRRAFRNLPTIRVPTELETPGEATPIELHVNSLDSASTAESASRLPTPPMSTAREDLSEPGPNIIVIPESTGKREVSLAAQISAESQAGHQAGQSTTAVTAKSDVKGKALASLGSHQCVVCMENWKPKEKVKKLPCGHTFHYNCIKVCSLALLFLFSMCAGVLSILCLTAPFSQLWFDEHNQW